MPRTTRPTTAFAPLAGAVLLLGIADSMVGSYSVLFAADEVGLGPVQVGVFVSAPAVGGILIGSALGRRFDRRPTRRYAALVAVAGRSGSRSWPSTGPSLSWCSQRRR